MQSNVKSFLELTCICGGWLCAGVQTRILVTHGISFLSHVDLIVVITNGAISELGTYEELLSHRGPFAELIHSYLAEASHELEDEGCWLFLSDNSVLMVTFSTSKFA